MKNSNILKMGIIGTLVLVVLASGCISSSSTGTKTFSDSAMSFNYPGDFDNGTYSGNDTNSNSSMQVIGKLENTLPLRVHDIWVAKNISAISPTEARDGVVSVVKNMSKGEVLSINTENNPNGIVVEETTYNTDLVLGIIKKRHNDMFFKINDTVYRITVDGADTDISTQNIKNTAYIIFQSIK